jgi:hypothetical protein
METGAVSETLDTNSALTRRISGEDFTVHVATSPKTMKIILTCWQEGSFNFTDLFHVV